MILKLDIIVLMDIVLLVSDMMHEYFQGMKYEYTILFC